MGTIYQRTVLQFKDVCLSSHNMLLTCCPHFSALTAPRFSVDKSKGTGSVMSFDDEGRGGGVKLGNGCAWKFSCACHQQKIYLIQPSCCASINFEQHPHHLLPCKAKIVCKCPTSFLTQPDKFQIFQSPKHRQQSNACGNVEVSLMSSI